MALALVLLAVAVAGASPPIAAAALSVTEAATDLEMGVLTIRGVSFGLDVPQVTLAGAPLVVLSSSDQQITAELPAGIQPGSYRLVVTSGNGTQRIDDFEVAIEQSDGSGSEITAVLAGSGLTGGGSSGDLELGLDLGLTDGRYARLDAENFFQLDQHVPNLWAGGNIGARELAAEAIVINQPNDGSFGIISNLNAADGGGAISANAFGVNQSAVSGGVHNPSGFSIGLDIVAQSPDAWAGSFVNYGGGRVLRAAGLDDHDVFLVEGDGRVIARGALDFTATVEGTASGEWGLGLVGRADHPDFGVGVKGELLASEGYALYGFAPGTSGNTRALFAEVFSPDGTAGYFVNGDPSGTILSGHTTNEALVFRVDPFGVHANGYYDLAGNPVFAGGDVTAVHAGAGLAGGGDAGELTLELDFGQLDGVYARLDSDNTFAGTQRAPTFIAEHVDESPSIQGRNFAAGFGVGVLGESTGENGVALYGTSYAASGGTLGVRAEVWSPDGIAGSFHNAGDGRLLEASTPTHGQVMTLEADGLFNVRQVNASSNFEPGEGEQIFVIDALATATSGHTRGVNATTFSPQSSAVVGSAQPSEGGTGGAFDSYGVNGTGVSAVASASTGGGVGLYAESWSPEGVAGRFVNMGGGQLVSGINGIHGEVFRVEADGTVRGTAFTDMLGNPVFGAGGDVSAVFAGPGLAGGGDSGELQLEVDFGALDARYAMLDQENHFGATQHMPQLFATQASVEELTVQSGTEGAFVINAFSLATSGPGRAVHAIMSSPDGIAITGHAAAPGPGGAVGILGSTDAEDGAGIEAFAQATTGNAAGLRARTSAPNGVGVLAAVDASGPGNADALFASLGTDDGNAGAFVAHSTTGSPFGINVETHSPNATTALLHSVGDGALLLGRSSQGDVFRVDADGTVHASQYLTASSRRWKENVHELEGALDAVSRLRGVSFDWKRDGRSDIGLIAEEVAEVVPEVVGLDEQGATGVDYARLTAILVQAVKEQQGVIDELREELASLAEVVHGTATR